jgi:GT2 family glycosyltransferase
MKLAVVVATYRRPECLQRCLNSLARQQRIPDEVIVVSRVTDHMTHSALGTTAGIRSVHVATPGVVAALETGVAASTADVVAFTDDDAEPRRDWLRLIEDAFAREPDIGAVGGRDWVSHGGCLVGGEATDVGRMQWFGRVTSGHHLGIGRARDVDSLKGVNMAFRRSVLLAAGFDHRLRGDGAQVHFELGLCLAARRRGWRVVYDPAIAVDHYPAQRFGQDQRGASSEVAISDATYNETLVVLDHLPKLRRVAFGIWGFCIGTRWNPGLIAAARLLAEGRPAIRALRAAQAGRLAGWATFLRGRRGAAAPPCRLWTADDPRLS